MSQTRSATNTLTFNNAKIFPLSLQSEQPQQKAEASNKLPLNLFHSTTSYNKMLITYGKNRKKNISQITDGIITSLEYVNDQIFNKQIHQRQSTKHKQYQSMNQDNHQESNQQRCFLSKHQGRQSKIHNAQPKHNNIQTKYYNIQTKHNNLQPKYTHSRKITAKHDDCNCCCCQDFCKQCANTTAKCCKISESVLTHAKQTIDQQIMLAKQRKTISYNSKIKINKSNINDQRNSKIDNSRNSKIDNSRNSKINSKLSGISQKAYSTIDINRRYRQKSLETSKQSTKKNIDISHLLIKSLIQFNQQKKSQKRHEQYKQHQKQAHYQLICQLNNQIRQNNLSYSRNKKSKSSQKSISKQTIGVQYWQRVKNQVMDSIRNDNYSKTLKQKLNQFQFQIYQHKDYKRQLTMTKEQIQYQRKIRDQQAQMIIKYKQMEKMSKAKIIQKNLTHLQSNRIHHIKSCKKRAFHPTADVIQNAFKNIIEPCENKSDIQIFKNQKLKKTHKKVRK